MVNRCCISRCTSKTGQKPIKFHKIPKGIIGAAWIRFIKSTKPEFVQFKHSVVCSKHFRPSQYYKIFRSPLNTMCLNNQAIPSIMPEVVSGYTGKMPKIQPSKNQDAANDLRNNVQSARSIIEEHSYIRKPSSDTPDPKTRNRGAPTVAPADYRHYRHTDHSYCKKPWIPSDIVQRLENDNTSCPIG